MLRSVSQHTCSKCGRAFDLPELPSAFDRFFRRPERYVPPDRDLYVTCPNCGTREIAQERRFLGGLAGPRFMQVVLYLFGIVHRVYRSLSS
jgi:DNA-directed RNA polymerase subunit RPC12/RpoP